MKKICVLLFLCFPILIPLKSDAAHAAGIYLGYEHLTGNDYRIHYVFFRNCDGIPVQSSYVINGKSACGNNVSITVALDSSVDISQMCEGFANDCAGAANPYFGVAANYFHGDVTLPAPCSLWTFSNIPICNRYNNITNLSFGGNAWCYYVEAKLNNADFPDNSSPVYNALPLFFQATQIRYQHFYATDADGDSLVFEMYAPHSNDSVDVEYINGLSATQPVTYAVPADSTRFNPATGDIRFKANAAQITVVGVRVNEYRNGAFVGSAERDMEVIFENSTSHAPTASGINGTTTYTAHICADSLLNFYIITTDADGDSIRISWQNNMPESSVYLSGADSNIVNFSWHPQASDISDIPYTFTVFLTDSGCPYVYFNSYEYHIYVDSCFAITGMNSPNDGVSFNATFSTSDQAFVYRIESTNTQEGEVCLVDLQGRKIWSQELTPGKRFQGTIPASSLTPGLYLLQMKSLYGVSRTLKVMKN